MQFPALEIDHDITDWVVDHRLDWLDTPFHVITTVGNTLAMTIIAIVAGLLFARAHRRSQAWLIVIGSATGYLVMVGLKHLFARDRPPQADRLVDIDTYAFPSGHAMMSGIVLGLIVVSLWQSAPWVRRHRAILWIAPAASLLIGASRVYLGVHWASDVVGGWLFALVWIGVAVMVQRRSAQALLRRPVAASTGASLDEKDRRAEQSDTEPDQAAYERGGGADAGDPDDDRGDQPERHPDVDHHLR
ncbi:hypothetical protein GCM10009619_07040 [Williamsia maris]|uniref:Undecaprenyl-diphosphatase n=1 Tax=Williamsia maris TaxID=72806 RepID=A0ABT1H9F7_9NOCA|nr:undecaprenyl-diphosphatase [Williamsia maris]